MTPSEVISVRVPPLTAARIDQHVDRLSKLTGGVPITRGDVVRILIERALPTMDAEAQAQGHKPRAPHGR